TGMVDMFDAGPIITCPLKDIRVVRESKKVPVSEIVVGELAGEEQLIANARAEFRACTGAAQTAPDGGARISAACAKALGVKQAEAGRFAPLRHWVARARV